MRPSQRIRQRLEQRVRELGYASIEDARRDFHEDVKALLGPRHKTKVLSHEQIEAAKNAEELARVVASGSLVLAIYEDMEAGNRGGTYYLDGTRVTARGRDIYAVGGGVEIPEIALKYSELESEENVRAVLGYLSEWIVRLQEMCDCPVCIGYWINRERCYFDVSDIVEGRERAEALALSRREVAYFGFLEGREHRTDFLKKRHPELDAWLTDFIEKRQKAHAAAACPQ